MTVTDLLGTRRILAALHSPAMLKKLAASRRQNQVDLAPQELGRVERTLFILDWLGSP